MYPNEKSGEKPERIICESLLGGADQEWRELTCSTLVCPTHFPTLLVALDPEILGGLLTWLKSKAETSSLQEEHLRSS